MLFRSLRVRFVTGVDLAVRLEPGYATLSPDARLLIMEWQGEPIGFLVDAVTDAMVAVSYTHLDVYKRQRLGRGHVAASFTGRSAQPGSRRVTIKTRLVNLKQAGARSTTTHLRYIERDGVGRDGEPGQAYGSTTDNADLVAFEERGREDLSLIHI